MKCPKCDIDLQPVVRHKLPMNICPTCKGMWLEHDELGQLEDEAFDFGEHAKGTLIVDSTATTHKCPQCQSALQRFRYRFYDIEMEMCANSHGYWLEQDEDDRVLELMSKEESALKRSLVAEDQWTRMLAHMRSHSFFEKLRDLFR